MAMIAELDAAAQAGDIEKLYTLIPYDPRVLEKTDEIPFVDTPLHIAAYAGQIRFAAEIMRLKPSFAWKLNQQGLSPMHRALQNGHNSMVLRFLSINKDLVRVKGKEGRTPLHYAAETGQTDILAAFVSACPDSIEDLTVEGETALHIAVKKGQFEALQVLVGWLRRRSYQLKESILNWKNESGDTILHVSARLKDVQTAKFLIKNGMKLNTMNSEGSTPLDIVEMPQFADANIKNMLLRAKALRGTDVTAAPTLAVKLKSKITFADEILIKIHSMRSAIRANKTRDLIVAVAVLIATMTYQSALSPPGGVYPAADSGNSINNNTSSVPAPDLNSTSLNSSTRGNQLLLQGKSLIPHEKFVIFWIYNTSSLTLSTLTILFLMPMGIISLLAICALVYFAGCYLIAMSIISPDHKLSLLNLHLLLVMVTIYIGLPVLKIKFDKMLERKGGISEIQSMSSGGNRW